MERKKEFVVVVVVVGVFVLFCLIGFLIDFIFCRLAETTVSGSPSVT